MQASALKRLRLSQRQQLVWHCRQAALLPRLCTRMGMWLLDTPCCPKQLSHQHQAVRSWSQTIAALYSRR